MAFQSIRAPSIASLVTERGLFSTVSTVALPYVIANTTYEPLVTVHPGKEMDIPVALTSSPLPPNANVEQVVARVHVANASGTPAQDHVGVNITGPVSGDYEVAVNQPVRPRNVQLKLRGGEVFWTFGGVLTEVSYDLPDFAAALNTYLDKAQLTASVTELPFVLTADTPGQVGIEIQELHYSQVKTQTWSNPLDSTTRVDRNLALSFGTVVALPLDPLTDQPGQGVQLQSLSLDIGGPFGPDRLLGSVETHDGHQFATINSDYALAQRFTLSGTLLAGPCRCTGMTGLFTVDETAELYVALQRDANGTPAVDAPLAQTTLTLTPPEQPDGPPPWTFARFATPVELQTEVGYWMIVKGVRGSARLGLHAAVQSASTPLPVRRETLAINRGGQLWKSMFRVPPTPPVVALLGIVSLPGSDDQTAAVQLIVTGAPATGAPLEQRLDPAREPQTITLDAGGVNWRDVTLEIRAHAEGTLSMANVIRTYRLV